MKKLNGFTNETYLIDKIVYKTSLPMHNFYLNKENEKNVLEIFRNLNQDIIIKPINIEFDGKTLKSSFLYLSNHKTLEQLNLTKPIINMVIQCIKDIHKIEVSGKNIEKFDYYTMINHFLHSINTPLFDFKLPYSTILPTFERLQSLPQVLSHNDLVPGNILVDRDTSKLTLIDYDYVMLNNKFFDIASFLTETINDDELMQKYFINQCLKTKLITLDELELLNDCIKYQDLLWSLWANWIFEQTGKEIFKKIAKEKFERMTSRKRF